MATSVLHHGSPSSSPRSPRALRNLSVWYSEHEKKAPYPTASSYGIPPKVGFTPPSPTISPAWLEAYRQLSFGFGPSASSMGYGANIPDPVSQRMCAGSTTHTTPFFTTPSPPQPAVTPLARDVALTPKEAVQEIITSTPQTTESTPSESTKPTPLLVSSIELIPLSLETTCETTETNTDDNTPLSSGLSSPSRKRLSWADNGGRMLEESMAFMRDDEPWRCSKTSGGFTRSPIMTPCPSPTRNSSAPTLTFLDPLPETQAELTSALGTNGVQLESVLVRTPLVFCTIRVLNVSFEKTVCVRVTSDEWKTHTDVEASYFPGSSDGRSDRFYATVSVPNYTAAAALQFAIRMCAGGREFWDSNGGRNYRVGQSS